MNISVPLCHGDTISCILLCALSDLSRVQRWLGRQGKEDPKCTSLTNVTAQSPKYLCLEGQGQRVVLKVQGLDQQHQQDLW